jgi:hypothetical protein
MTRRTMLVPALAVALGAGTLATPVVQARPIDDAADAAALAQEGYYSSYGAAGTLSPVATPAPDGGGDTPWPTIALLVAGGGLAAGTGVAVARRGRRSRVAA